MTDLAAIQAEPTWEDAMSMMQSDGARGFRVDIETDSTIAADAEAEKQALAEMVGALGQVMTGLKPLAESGVMPPEVAKELILAVSRRFKLGRQFEDMLDQIGGQPAQQQPDPRIEAEKAKMQAEAAREQGRMQIEQQKLTQQADMDKQKLEQEMALHQQKMVMEQQVAIEKARIEATVQLMVERMRAQIVAQQTAEQAAMTPEPEDPGEDQSMQAMTQIADALAAMGASIDKAAQTVMAEVARPREITVSNMQRDGAGNLSGARMVKS